MGLSPAIQTVNCSSFFGRIVWEVVSNTNIKADNIHGLYFIYSVGHFVIEGDWIDQTQPALLKTMQAASDLSVVLHVLCDAVIKVRLTGL